MIEGPDQVVIGPWMYGTFANLRLDASGLVEEGPCLWRSEEPSLRMISIALSSWIFNMGVSPVMRLFEAEGWALEDIPRIGLVGLRLGGGCWSLGSLYRHIEVWVRNTWRVDRPNVGRTMSSSSLEELQGTRWILACGQWS